MKLISGLALYLASWAIAFVAIVGWRPELAGPYFIRGWTFQGLELVAFVWAASLAIFAVALAMAAIAGRIWRSRRATV